MKVILIFIMGLLPFSYGYAIECQNISNDFFGVPIKSKFIEPNGYKVIGYPGNKEHQSKGFVRRENGIEEVIKVRYLNNSSYLISATIEFQKKLEAVNKLESLVNKIGANNLTARDNGEHPSYYANCEDSISVSLQIAELHKRKVSYLVQIFIKDEVVFKKITGKHHY